MSTLFKEWRNPVARCVLQHPLIETRPSIASLERTGQMSRPGAVFIGIGLCSPSELTRAVPIDLLGMLLPAVQLRDAVGARDLVILIADRHAVTNGFRPDEVERRARLVEDVLCHLRERMAIERMQVVRASSFHDSGDYRRLLSAMRWHGAADEHEYVRRQLADVMYFGNTYGGVLKVGWVLDRSDETADSIRDERSLDLLLPDACEDRVGFVYCKPGRALYDDAPKAPPYIATRPGARVCLDPNESPTAKFSAAERHSSPEAINGCRRYLKAIAYSYGREIEPLPRGSLETRLRVLIERLTPDERAPVEAA